MKLHTFHCREGDRKWWVVADDKGDRVITGKVGGTRTKAVDKWIELHGAVGLPLDGSILYRGMCSRAEVAATLASLSLGG